MAADAERADRRSPHTEGRRSPGRFLAPVALVIVVVAVIVIVASAGSSPSSSPASVVASSTTTRDASGSSGTTAHTGTLTQSGTSSATATTSPTATSTVGTYTIQAGDTFSVISEKTGVSIATLETLNPGVSSSALTVGQVIKLK
jgi:LysM repeat protein